MKNWSEAVSDIVKEVYTIRLNANVTPIMRLYICVAIIIKSLPNKQVMTYIIERMFRMRYNNLFKNLAKTADELDELDEHNAETNKAYEKFTKILEENPDLKGFVFFSKITINRPNYERVVKLEDRFMRRFLKLYYGVKSMEEFFCEVENTSKENFYEKVDENLLVEIANNRHDPQRRIARNALQTEVLNLSDAIPLFERMANHA